MEVASHQLEVFSTGEAFFDGGVLAGEPDARSHLRRLGDDVDAVDECSTAIGPQQRGENAYRGGLACPVGPEQPEHATFGHLEIEAVERPLLSVLFDQALGNDCMHGPDSTDDL